MLKQKFYFGLILVALILPGAGCISFSGGSSTGPMGMFKSIDKGDNWLAASTFPTPQGIKSISGIKSFRLYPDPGDANAFYLTTRGQGLYYTYNNGESWQSAEAMAGRFIYGLAIDPKDKCVIYATDGASIFKTADCSRSWKQIYSEQRPSQRFAALAVDYANSNFVYGAQTGGDLFKSDDGGKSWRVINRFGFEIRDLQADSLVPGRIYVAAYADGLYRSDDSGKKWENLRAGLAGFSRGLQFYRLVLNTGTADSLFWISKFGILRSDNAGETWEQLSLLTPPGSVNIYGFAINPKNQKEIYYTGTILGEKNVHVRSTFYKSTDGGVNWLTKKLPSNTIPTTVLVHSVNQNILFLGFTMLDS